MSQQSFEVYSRDDCIYCDKAKALLKNRGFQFVEYDVTVKSNKEALLARFPQASTIPQIFIRGRHIGGYDDLAEYLEETSGGFGDNFK